MTSGGWRVAKLVDSEMAWIVVIAGSLHASQYATFQPPLQMYIQPTSTTEHHLVGRTGLSLRRDNLEWHHTCSHAHASLRHSRLPSAILHSLQAFILFTKPITSSSFPLHLLPFLKVEEIPLVANPRTAYFLERLPIVLLKDTVDTSSYF